jgi:hypothetical protein
MMGPLLVAVSALLRRISVVGILGFVLFRRVPSSEARADESM